MGAGATVCLGSGLVSEPVAEAFQIRGRVHDKKDAARSIANAIVTLKETGAGDPLAHASPGVAVRIGLWHW